MEVSSALNVEYCIVSVNLVGLTFLQADNRHISEFDLVGGLVDRHDEQKPPKAGPELRW